MQVQRETTWACGSEDSLHSTSLQYVEHEALPGSKLKKRGLKQKAKHEEALNRLLHGDLPKLGGPENSARLCVPAQAQSTDSVFINHAAMQQISFIALIQAPTEQLSTAYGEFCTCGLDHQADSTSKPIAGAVALPDKMLEGR